MKRVTAALLVMCCILVFSHCSGNKRNSTVMEKKAITVKVEQVKRGEFSKFLYYKGTVSPWKKANIAPEASGRIGRIYKKPGDRVQKYDLLAELDTTTLKLQLNQAEAAAAVARAGYQDAKLTLERLQKLFETNAISQVQLEKAQLGLESAHTQFKSAEANLNVVRHTLQNSYMKAPFPGIITSKNMEEGDMINPMMGMGASVLTLMDLSQVKIVLDVSSDDIEKVQIDQRCEIAVDSLGNKKFEGRVYSKNMAADPVSKTFKVEVKIENPQIEIKAGVFAEVGIKILYKTDILLIPLSAVIDSRSVVVVENGAARNVDVRIGESNENQVEILEGLSEGQQVVVEGNYDLKDGAPITIEGANT